TRGCDSLGRTTRLASQLLRSGRTHERTPRKLGQGGRAVDLLRDQMLSLLYAHQAQCSRMFLRERADGKVSVDCGPSEESKLAAEARRQDLAFRRDDAE